MSLFNFRDLGGLPTRCQRQTIHGRLFRTANVSHWNAEAADKIVREHGVRLYIDFRKKAEIEKFGRPTPLLERGVEWFHLPIDYSDPEFEKLRLPKVKDWVRLYQVLFEKNIDSFVKFAQTISLVEEPIFYGCLFGKDRTGVATSLLLNILDVHDDHIISDYAKTTHELRPLTNLFQHLLENHGASEEELFEHYSRSHEEVMNAFLEYLRAHPEDHPIGQTLQRVFHDFKEPLKSRLLS